MATFDDVVGKAKDIAEIAEKKAEKVVELSKLKIQVSQLNSDVKKAYEKLGSAVYNMKKADYRDEELIASVAEEIDGLLEEKAKAEAKIALLRKQTLCGTCGAKNSSDAVYCTKCGSRLESEEEQE